MIKKLTDVLWPARHPIDAIETVRRWLGSPESQQPWIFIVGAPRSGTTLIKTLLVAHSELGGTDYESTGIFRFRNLQLYCPSDLTREQMATIRDETKRIVPFFDGVAQAVLKKREATKFVDKLTVRAWRLRYVARHFPRARFISIVRDGRDCLCSARRHPNVLQSKTVSGFADYWKFCVETPEMIIDKKHITTVRYEDLTTNPEPTLRTLMDFIGHRFEPGQVDPDVYSTTSTMKKREVHRNLAQRINTKSLQRWRTDLSDSDINVFEQVAGETLLSLKYELSGAIA